jgi:hypothetical protein
MGDWEVPVRALQCGPGPRKAQYLVATAIETGFEPNVSTE